LLWTVTLEGSEPVGAGELQYSMRNSSLILRYTWEQMRLFKRVLSHNGKIMPRV
jgi:hypothetical protein